MRVAPTPAFGAPSYEGPFFLGRLELGQWGRFAVNGRFGHEDGWTYAVRVLAFHLGSPDPEFFGSEPAFDHRIFRHLWGTPRLEK